jgi:predicted ATPase/class 3 adenylate cyclase
MTSSAAAAPQQDTEPISFGRLSRVPRRRTSFVGRESDVPAVMTRLGEAPAVTLVGVGGVGKTSLAYEVASRIEHDGSAVVHVVPLQSTVDSDAVDRVVADSLGLPVAAQQSPIDAVVTCLCVQGPTVLLLDNCEQVIDGASRLVDELLDRCDQLRVLATSRIVLGVEGEHVWPVDPLLVDDEAPDDGPAVRLLVDRATAAHPRALDDTDRQKLVQLASRLDGLPLALELAAARLSTMSIDELLEQLDGHLLALETNKRSTEDRHRSLEGVVEWSYRLLDEDARLAAQRLSVFPSTFTRESAERVMASGDRGMLDNLLNDSLVTITERDGGARILMLEMIRQFLGERLEKSGDAEAARREHAAWTVETVVELTRLVRGPNAAVHRRRLVAELENVRVAIEWAVAHGDIDALVKLARGLHDHIVGAARREVHAWIERALATVWDDPRAADVLIVGAEAAMTRGDLTRYREVVEQLDRVLADSPDPVVVVGTDNKKVWLGLQWMGLLGFEGKVDQAVEVADGLLDSIPDDPWEASWTLMRLSMPYAYAGRDELAGDLAQRSVDLAEGIDNELAVCWSRFALGEALRTIDPERAIASYEQAFSIADQSGFAFLEGLILVGWASALGRHGEPVPALERYRQAMRFWRDANGWSFLSTTLRNFGEFLARIDRPEQAVLVRCAIEEISRSSKAGGEDADTDRYLRRKLVADLGKARFEQLQEESHRLDETHVVQLALDTIESELDERVDPEPSSDAAEQVPAPELADESPKSDHAEPSAEDPLAPLVFRVIAFTDLESSTSYMARKDRDARTAMREYDRRTRKTLEKHGGRHWKGTGDGVLATFSTVTEALVWVVEFQKDIEEAVESGELPLRVRVGVHAGETIEDLDDVYGTAVNLAARVVDQAGPGEVLVTGAVQEMALGGQHRFSSRGKVELKGIPEPIGLYSLDWR